MLKGSMEIFSGFLGYQFTLLLFPYITRTTKLFKGIFLGHSFTLLIYLGICIVSYGFFSFDQLKAIIYPLISIMKFIETPIIERLENIIFNVFVLKMLVTKVMYYWGAFEMLKEIFKRVNPSFLLFLTVAIPHVTASFVNLNLEITLWNTYLNYVDIFLAFALPTLLYFLLLSQNSQKVKKETSNG